MFLAGVEALVGWLLDHPDVQITDLSDADTISDEYSDEEVVDDVEEAESAYPVVSARTKSDEQFENLFFLCLVQLQLLRTTGT